MQEANKRLGRNVPPQSPDFNISKNIEDVKKDFVKAGFSDKIKHWYQPANWNYEDGADFVEKFMVTIPGNPELDSEMRKTITEIYDE